MKALICCICMDIRGLDPSRKWTTCRCGNVSARWVDTGPGHVEVRAQDKEAVRMLGLNNAFLEPALTAGVHDRDCEAWASLHKLATKAPGFLFDEKWRGCWAVVYSVGETGDTKWHSSVEDTLPPPSSAATERAPAPPTDPSLHKLATISGEPPAAGYERADAPQPVDPATGQNKDHWVLPEEERAKGYIRPVRRGTTHLKCGTTTYMPVDCAETYARDPKFYSKTFCFSCKAYLPVGPDGEFVWEGTQEKVGT